MKVKILVSMAGHAHVWNVGDVVEVDAAEGDRLLAAGRVELMERAPARSRATPVETAQASVAGVETAAKRPVSRRKSDKSAS